MAAIHEADWSIQSPFTLIRKWPLAKDTFQVETEMRCSYWSDGKHIIADGQCRCGKLFEIVEVEKRVS